MFVETQSLAELDIIYFQSLELWEWWTFLSLCLEYVVCDIIIVYKVQLNTQEKLHVHLVNLLNLLAKCVCVFLQLKLERRA